MKKFKEYILESSIPYIELKHSEIDKKYNKEKVSMKDFKKDMKKYFKTLNQNDVVKIDMFLQNVILSGYVRPDVIQLYSDIGGSAIMPVEK